MANDLSLIINQPNEGKFLETIAWNKEEFMEIVKSITEGYQGLTYSEKDIKAAKADRARLNGMKKAISDRRIDVKKAIMAPYTVFENEVKEVTELIDGPIRMIDVQIKEYEDRVKKEKREALEEYFNKEAEQYSEFLTFDKVYNERFMNTSYTLKKAKEEIIGKITRIATDIRSIDAFASEKYRMHAMDVYQKTLDVNAALAEDKRLNDLDKKREAEEAKREAIAEQKRVEEEARRAKIAEKEAIAMKAREEQAKREQEGIAPKLTEESVTKQEVVVSEPQEIVSEPTRSVPEEEKVIDSFAPKPTKCKASFTVYGTKEDIMKLKQFMIENNIQFGKVE